jgi:cytoskeleton protein RodZ
MVDETTPPDEQGEGEGPAERRDPVSRPGPGAVLRAARERTGKTISDAARALCLEVYMVEAIEADQYEVFGAAVFARGHLRRYAGIVDCDADEVLSAWDEHFAPPPPKAAPATQHVQVRKPANALPMIITAGVAGALVLGSVLVWLWLRPPGDGLEAGARGDGSAAAVPAGRRARGDVGAPAPGDALDPSGGDIADDAGPGAPGPAQPDRNMPRREYSAPSTPESAADAVSAAGVDAAGVIDTDASADDADVADATAPEAAATVVDGIGNRAPADAPPGQLSPGDVTDAAGEASSPGADADAGGTVALRFSFDVECWVSVSDATGERLMFGLRRPGRVDERVGVPPIAVTLGRYPGVSVSVDGVPFVVPEDAVNGGIARFEIPAP